MYIYVAGSHQLPGKRIGDKKNAHKINFVPT